MQRLRIGTTYKDGTSNARYRAEIPLRELGRRGHSVVRPSADGSFAGLVLAGERPPWDVALVQQATGDDDLAAIRRLRELGVAVVWDSDDDVRGIPRHSPAHHRAGGRRGIKRLFRRTVEIARSAHLMTTPSAWLADVYRAEGVRDVAVIENHLPADASDRPARHAGVVVGVVAALEHERDLERLRLGRTLRELLARQPEVRVVAVGCGLGFEHPRLTWHRVLPHDRLRQLTRGFDVGLAPLVDGTLARARSNVKLKEYAAGGATWLASPIGPYVGMGAAQGGELVADGDWLEAVEALVSDPAGRAERAAAARAWAAGETIVTGARLWERALRAAIERARAEARRASAAA